jgi:NADH-quinone oxidoreductase subunit L
MVTMTAYIWLVPLFPLLGFLINAFNYKRFKGTLAGVLASVAVFAAFVVALVAFFEIAGTKQAQTIDLFSWIAFGKMSIPFSFLYDQLSGLMLLIITGVGFLIHVYSIGYMKEDAGFNRYFSYLNLFVFFMLMLVLGSNYLVMFIGWEGVGLCSYLLIGFWFKNHDYNNAAKKAFIMNRIGDLGFLLAVFMIFQTFGTLSFDGVFTQAAGMSSSTTLTLITLFLFIGATGKSAQIPLFTWLPDAMAGPTPVSALIHAATMVTAGIYMIARSNILYALSPFTMGVITAIGIMTALLAGAVAIFQTDIKKVLAYSTVSHLGFMFLALGVGSFTGAMFHLTTHAFFKALLFLGAGSVIHAMNGEQDIRNMGALKSKIPVTFFTFLMGTLAIAGIPPFSGFFSKDLILLSAFEKSPALWIIATVIALMSSIYMFRLLFIVFFGKEHGNTHAHHHVHESPKSMTVPMSILAVLSVVAGFIGLPQLMGGNDWFGEFLSPVFAQSAGILNASAHEVSHSTEWLLMLVPVAIIAVIIYVTYRMFAINNVLPVADDQPRPFFSNLMYRKFYIDELYNVVIERPIACLSTFFHNVIEVKVIDWFVDLIGALVVHSGLIIRKIQTGNIGTYLFIMVFSIVAILLINLFA